MVEEVIAAFLTVPHAENLIVLMASRMKEAMTAVEAARAATVIATKTNTKNEEKSEVDVVMEYSIGSVSTAVKLVESLGQQVRNDNSGHFASLWDQQKNDGLRGVQAWTEHYPAGSEPNHETIVSWMGPLVRFRALAEKKEAYVVHSANQLARPFVTTRTPASTFLPLQRQEYYKIKAILLHYGVAYVPPDAPPPPPPPGNHHIVDGLCYRWLLT